MKQNSPTAAQGHVSRRRFFGYAGALAGAGVLATSLSACNNDDDSNNGASVNLGSGDFGILNYAYALEQLEAAFYLQVLKTEYTGMDATERAMLSDIRDHEVAHREFFKKALGGNAIPSLRVDFSSIDFTSRTSVLGASRSFEDLGVQAYNGAGKYLLSPDYLTLAGKIVSVEARHAAYIRDLIQMGSFADTSILNPDTRGDYAKEPTEVLAIADKYIVDTINANDLPKI